MLGHPKHDADWFNDNDGSISELIQQEHSALQACLTKQTCQRNRPKFAEVKANLQRELRQMEDAWWDNNVEEIQHLANTGDARGFFQAIKTIYGPQGASTTPILATDGTTVLSEGSEILGRWKTHFDHLLNQRSEANPDVLNRIPQRPILQTTLSDWRRLNWP